MSAAEQPESATRPLPPLWDGMPIVWDGWESTLDMRICPPVLSCCSACGSLARQAMNRGRVAISSVVTHQMIAARDAERDRLPPREAHRRKCLALYRLAAFRCPDCHHDQVLEDGVHWWDLDESDYQPEGSWPSHDTPPAPLDDRRREEGTP